MLQPSLFNFWFCNLWIRHCHGELRLSVDQCQLQVLQFLVHLINALSILLRCNGFTGIHKAIVDQKGSRLPNSGHDLFWCNFGFGKCFELLLNPDTKLVLTGCHIESTFHCMSQSNQ